MEQLQRRNLQKTEKVKCKVTSIGSKSLFVIYILKLGKRKQDNRSPDKEKRVEKKGKDDDSKKVDESNDKTNDLDNTDGVRRSKRRSTNRK